VSGEVGFVRSSAIGGCVSLCGCFCKGVRGWKLHVEF
jgi:hypothetical protein